METLQDDDYALLEEETADPPKPRPLTPSTEDIEMLSGIKDYEYSVHHTHHPAAPVIISRYKKFDTPGNIQHAAQAIVASVIPDDPELD